MAVTWKALPKIASTLTGTRLLASDANGELTSVADLSAWIAGVANRVIIANDGDGTITISLPQDIHSAAAPTFAGLIAPYLRPGADSTTALQLQNAAGTSILTVDTTNTGIRIPSGWLQVGNETADARFSIYVDRTFTTNELRRGLFTQMRLSTASVTINTEQTGVYGKVYFGTGGNTLADANGVLGEIQHNNTSTMTYAHGTRGRVSLTAAGTISAAFGLRATVTKSAGTITTAYGLYVDDTTAGGTNYAIYTGAGLVRFGDDIVMADAKNIQLNTTTGTKIGTSTSQKLGFFNATPVVRPSALTAANASALNTGDATSDTVIGNMRTRIGEIETKLQALGLLA